MNDLKPITSTQYKKLIRDSTDKKNSLIHYRKLNFYVRNGLIVDKVHDIFAFRQSK